jgi:hypothetical protein
MRTTDDVGRGRYDAPVPSTRLHGQSPAPEPVLAARLLRALGERLGDRMPQLCECWDEELCVVGTVGADGAQRLAFLSVDRTRPGRYNVLLDLATDDREGGERRDALEFDALCDLVAAHLAVAPPP